MGFHDRNYARDNWSPRRYGPTRSGRGFADWEVWKKLIAINIAVFLLQIFFTRPATDDDVRRMPFYGYDPYGAEYYDDEYGYGYEVDEFEEADQERDAQTQDDVTRGKSADADAVDSPEDQTAESERDVATKTGESANEQAEADDSKSNDADADNAGSDDASSKPVLTDKQKAAKEMRKNLERARAQMLEQMRVSIVQEWCELDSEKVKKGQLWRLITAGFCHDRTAIWHLLINMLFLYWFGSRLERVYGSAEFTAFYFAALLFSSLAYIGLDLYTHKMIPAIGASGAVWGVVALYALMYPYERIFIYFLFPVEIRWLVLLYFVFDLHPVLLAISGDHQPAGVAHAAHIGGAIFGFLYRQQGWRLMPIIDRLKSDAPRRKSIPRGRNDATDVLKISSGDERSESSNGDTDRMDEILTKISREGRESLTDEELEVLEETSRKMRHERKGKS